MSGKTFFSLAALALPPVVLSLAAHHIIAAETARGREIGRAYLQARADAAAAEIRRTKNLSLPTEDGAPKHICAIAAPGGKWLGAPLPDDGRCRGTAALSPEFPGHSVQVCWAGTRNPGLARKQRLRRVEFSVYAVCLTAFMAAALALTRALVKTGRELRRQRRDVEIFSHRLKTPITSISLCAELAMSGRIDRERRLECAETIVAEARKLDEIVGEVLQTLGKTRTG